MMQQKKKFKKIELALNKKFGKDTVQLEADLVKLQATFITTQATNADKQKDITRKLYGELDAVRKADYEATLMLNKQLSDKDKQKLDRALAGGKDFLNVVSKDSKEIQRILEAYQQDQIVNEITYQQTINKISEDLEPYAFLNHYVAPLFYNIEKQGIKLSKDPFIEHFKTLPNPKFSVSKGKIYTQYNLNTLTGRPSNAFNGINFAALNKTNGERAAFIPENDTLVEIDFKAYHPTIIAKLAGYEFTGNIYDQLANEFPGSTPETIKELVFQQLYGGVRKDFQDKPFFKQVNDYTNQLWSNDRVIGTQFGKRFTKEMIENPTPQKLLNYIVQNTETIFNVVQFSAVMNLLKDKKT